MPQSTNKKRNTLLITPQGEGEVWSNYRRNEERREFLTWCRIRKTAAREGHGTIWMRHASKSGSAPKALGGSEAPNQRQSRSKVRSTESRRSASAKKKAVPSGTAFRISSGMLLEAATTYSPRYALRISGFAKSLSASSSMTTLPVSRTYPL